MANEIRAIVIGMLLALVCGLSLCVAYASAADDVRLVHKPDQLSEMPLPGIPLTLSLKLRGTRSLKYNLITEIVRDGRNFQISTPKPFMNELEQPSFSLNLSAPIADLSYRFTVHNQNGQQVAQSPWYYSRRSCVPNIAEPKLELEEEAPQSQKAVSIKAYATELEHEIDRYETAITLLKEIRQLIEK